MGRRPPNIDEFGNLILLRQALDILAAPEDEQHALFPPERDAPTEMRLLFEDAWQRVRPVFAPAIPEAALGALDRIAAALVAVPVDWETVRTDARASRTGIPGRTDANGRPRPWDEQVVRARNRLLLRRQL